ncbi:Uncharacterized protein NEOC65_000921 [Neochlamydia sp. AcF65]|nr:Uncharacterized protein [Neochlamydia sp. AcF65]
MPDLKNTKGLNLINHVQRIKSVRNFAKLAKEKVAAIAFFQPSRLKS